MSTMKTMQMRFNELSEILNYDVYTNIYQSMYRNYNMFVREFGYKHNVYLMSVLMYSIHTPESNLEKIEEILKLGSKYDTWLLHRCDLQYRRTFEGLLRYKRDDIPFKSYRLIYRILKLSIEIKHPGFASKTVKLLRNDMFDILNSKNPEYVTDFVNMLISEAKDEKELKQIRSEIMNMKLSN